MELETVDVGNAVDVELGVLLESKLDGLVVCCTMVLEIPDDLEAEEDVE